MKIVIDAMGGDNAPRAMVEGAVLAVKSLDCQIVLVGDEVIITSLLANREPDKISIVHASEQIGMEESAVSSIRGKKDSSLAVGMKLLADGKADALVSAGNTGAVLSGATLIVKRVKGIRRAALAPLLPTAKGGSLLIDCGANSDCTPEYLLQFAILGYAYMQKIKGIDNPTVALISNGTEQGKGAALQKEAFVLLKQAGERGQINFIGNIEGRDIPYGAADVLVCDGFTGNVVLKTIEGVAMFLMKEIKGIMMESTKTRLAAMALKPGLERLKDKMDYKQVGGAPMLGISKPVIKAHGSCDEGAVLSAVREAVKFIESGYIAHIEQNLSDMAYEKDGE